jgi:hypothetical protein
MAIVYKMVPEITILVAEVLCCIFLKYFHGQRHLYIKMQITELVNDNHLVSITFFCRFEVPAD